MAEAGKAVLPRPRLAQWSPTATYTTSGIPPKPPTQIRSQAHGVPGEAIVAISMEGEAEVFCSFMHEEAFLYPLTARFWPTATILFKAGTLIAATGTGPGDAALQTSGSSKMGNGTMVTAMRFTLKYTTLLAPIYSTAQRPCGASRTAAHTTEMTIFDAPRKTG